jgi:hypothetical protein
MTEARICESGAILTPLNLQGSQTMRCNRSSKNMQILRSFQIAKQRDGGRVKF